MKAHFTDIDHYINTFPDPAKEKLVEMRSIIHQAAPEAKEKISYQIPTFTFHGNLVHFAAFEHHIGFYPAPSAISAFKKSLRFINKPRALFNFLLSNHCQKN